MLCEGLLLSRWSGVYFRYGIPVFRCSVTLPANPRVPSEVLEVACEGTWGPRLLFRELGAGHIAFREALSSPPWRHYSPVMHGLIVCRPAQRDAVVFGHLNWWVPTALAVFLVGEGWQGMLLLGCAPVVILGSLYGIQARRYRWVAKGLFAVAHGYPSVHLSPPSRVRA